jgi:hypothetical protein
MKFMLSSVVLRIHRGRFELLYALAHNLSYMSHTLACTHKNLYQIQEKKIIFAGPKEWHCRSKIDQKMGN